MTCQPGGCIACAPWWERLGWGLLLLMPLLWAVGSGFCQAPDREPLPKPPDLRPRIVLDSPAVRSPAASRRPTTGGSGPHLNLTAGSQRVALPENIPHPSASKATVAPDDLRASRIWPPASGISWIV